MTVRSPPWNRSTVSMADLTGNPLYRVDDAQFRKRLLERRPLRPVRHHDPQPVLGVQPMLLAGSAKARRIGSMSACSNGFRTWLSASSCVTTTNG